MSAKTWDEYWDQVTTEVDKQAVPGEAAQLKDSEAFKEAMRKAWRDGLTPQEAVRRYLAGTL